MCILGRRLQRSGFRIHLVQVRRPCTKQGSLIPEMVWWKLSRVREALVALMQCNHTRHHSLMLIIRHIQLENKEGHQLSDGGPHPFETGRRLCSEPADRQCLQLVCVPLPVVGADHVLDGEGPIIDCWAKPFRSWKIHKGAQNASHEAGGDALVCKVQTTLRR